MRTNPTSGAVCIVLLNKTLFVSYDFKFPVTLTGWHMCFTAATLWTACKMARGAPTYFLVHTPLRARGHPATSVIALRSDSMPFLCDVRSSLDVLLRVATLYHHRRRRPTILSPTH